MSTNDNDKRRAQFDALMELAQELPPMLDLQITEWEADQIAQASHLFGYYLPQMLHDAQRAPARPTPEQIDDEQFYGSAKWESGTLDALARYEGPPLRFNLVNWLKPQAEIVRRAIPPELSEVTHEAPHYSYLMSKKGGAD